MKGTSKLYTDFVLKKYVNHLQFDELLIAIKLLRTDTTLDLSQKAEKSCC